MLMASLENVSCILVFGNLAVLLIRASVFIIEPSDIFSTLRPLKAEDPISTPSGLRASQLSSHVLLSSSAPYPGASPLVNFYRLWRRTAD